MSRRILVVAAHPDDEVLGAGGAIAAHARHGDEVHVMILAEGATSRDAVRDQARRQAELDQLSGAARHAAEALGVASLSLHGFPDNRMDSVDLLDVVKVIEEKIAAIAPDTVYTHHAGDLNVDHRVTQQAVLTACRPVPGAPVKTLLFFEVPSSTEWQTSGTGDHFAPTWFVDISQTLEVKLRAVEAYHAELRPFPHPRSLQAVQHLAHWRGASVGCQAAEAFVLGRRLEQGESA